MIKKSGLKNMKVKTFYSNSREAYWFELDNHYSFYDLAQYIRCPDNLFQIKMLEYNGVYDKSHGCFYFQNASDIKILIEKFIEPYFIMKKLSEDWEDEEI